MTKSHRAWRIDQKTSKEIDAIAREEGITTTEVVERALADEVKRHQSVKQVVMGLFMVSMAIVGGIFYIL